MFRKLEKQLYIEEFALPFAGKLRADNRWVKLAKEASPITSIRLTTASCVNGEDMKSYNAPHCQDTEKIL